MHANNDETRQQSNRQQSGGDAAERTDAQGHAARRPTQRHQQSRKTNSTQEPVQAAKYPAWRRHIRAEVASREHATERTRDQQQIE